jgi:hypothetical protein
MNSRAAAWFVALVFLVVGSWMTWEGWQKKWKAKGLALRAGGAAMLIAGVYAGAAAARK